MGHLIAVTDAEPDLIIGVAEPTRFPALVSLLEQ